MRGRTRTVTLSALALVALLLVAVAAGVLLGVQLGGPAPDATGNGPGGPDGTTDVPGGATDSPDGTTDGYDGTGPDDAETTARPSGGDGTATDGGTSVGTAPGDTDAGGDGDAPPSVDDDRVTDEWHLQSDPDDPGTSSVDAGESVVASDDVERWVFAMVNDERRERGLEPYAYSDYMSSVARAHSEDMPDRGYFSHQNPDGELPWDRLGDDYGRHCRTVGENIAYNWVGRSVSSGSGTGTYDTEREVARALVTQWMNSDGHRSAILSDGYTVTGVGIYVEDVGGGDARVFATQMFCG